MSDINDDESAFPSSFMPESIGDCTGMTMRQYAAIKLKVPDSGTDWLDEMIAKSRRLDALEAIAPAIVTKTNDWDPIYNTKTHVSIAKLSHEIHAALRDFKA